VKTLAACQLPEDSTEIRAAALSPTLRGSWGGPDAVRHRHRPRHGRTHWIRGFHYVRTRRIRGFMAFQRAWRSETMLM